MYTAGNRRLFPKYLIVLICFVLIIGIINYHLNFKYILYTKRNVIIHFDIPQNNILSHYSAEGDALPPAEEPEFSPRPNSIFFHETSCSGGLNSRQACAVESAARAHPRRQVYVLFSAPVTRDVLIRSSLSKLRKFHNVRLARVHITDYAKNTPLEEMIARDPFNKSQWRVEHTSDVLRYLTLYKWGGLYLDTDMMVVKSLTPLGHNWVAKEDDSFINAAAVAISLDHLGRKLSQDLINEVKTTYRPDLWGYNGPGAVTRVVKKMCHPANMTDWSAKTCKGLNVYSCNYIYPIHYLNRNVYFKSGNLDNVENAYTHHFWNKLSHDTKVEKDSPYAKMAKKFCPTVFELYGERFGE